MIADPGRGTDPSAMAVRQTDTYKQIFIRVRNCAVPRIDDVSPESVKKVRRARAAFNVMSTGERIAVALVLNRYDWIEPESWTMLDAVARLGSDWLSAAILVHRDGWNTAENRWSEADATANLNYFREEQAVNALRKGSASGTYIHETPRKV